MDNADSGPARRTPAGRVKRALAIVGAGVASLLTLLFVVLAVFGDRWANGYAERAAADLSRQLGRPVRIGPVALSALRGRVEVRDVLIGAGADEPSSAPALMLTSASANIGMLRTLLTLGFYPYVEEVEVRDLRIHLVERADGTTNWARIAHSDAQEPPSDAPLDVRVRNARVGEVVVTGVDVGFVPRGQQRASARISQLDLRVEDAGYGVGGKLDLAAAVLSPARNLKAHAELGPLDEAGSLPPIDALEVALAPTQLAPIGAFLRAFAGRDAVPERGVLSIDVDVTAKESAETLAKGSVRLEDVVFPRGTPFSGELTFDMSANPEVGDLDLRSGTLQVGPMQVQARAKLENLNDAPALRGLALSSRDLSFAALRAIYPAFDQQTAPARLEGPFALSARGAGDARTQSADIALTLTETRIVVPDVLDKPAGTPLTLEARLQTGDHTLAFAPLRLQLASFALVANGKISELDRAAPRIALQIDTPNPEVESLLRLLPPIARAAKGSALAGKLALRGKLSGTTERFEADATLALSALRVNVPAAHLEGGGKAHLSLKNAGHGSEGKLAVDFTELTAMYADVVQKPGGTPLRVDATLAQKNGQSELTLSTALASLVMRANATLRGEAPKQSFTAKVDVPSCAVRGVARLLPGFDATTIGDIKLTGKLEAEGVLGQPATMRVNVPSFTASAGRSELRGTLSARDLDRPQIALTAKASYLDVDDFLPRGDAADATSAPDASAPASDDAGMLARIRGSVRLDVARGRAAQIELENLQAVLRLENGLATAEKLEVGVFGGRFTGTGSVFPLIPGRGRYQIKGGLENAQVATALEQLAGTRDLLTGMLTAKVDLDTRDLTVAALQRSLTGELAGTLTDGSYVPGHGFAALTTQLGALANAAPVQNALTQSRERLGITPGKAWELRKLAAVLRFEDGAAVLERPITLATPQGDVQLAGKLGLSSGSDLTGTFVVPANVLSDLTQGKVAFEQSISLPFQVQGALMQPAFHFDGLERVVQPLIAAYVREEGARHLERGAAKVLERPAVKERADEARRVLEKFGRQKHDGAKQ